MAASKDTYIYIYIHTVYVPYPCVIYIYKQSVIVPLEPTFRVSFNNLFLSGCH